MTYLETTDGLVFQSNHPEFHPDAKRLSRAEGARKHREYCIARLREIVKPGDTIYTVLRHVSGSGMTRRIDAYVIKNNCLQYLSGYAAGATGWKLSEKGGLVVGGCGMDMGFHLVYTLSYAIFKDSPPEGHKDGGYALRHEWI